MLCENRLPLVGDVTVPYSASPFLPPMTPFPRQRKWTRTVVGRLLWWPGGPRLPYLTIHSDDSTQPDRLQMQRIENGVCTVIWLVASSAATVVYCLQSPPRSPRPPLA